MFLTRDENSLGRVCLWIDIKREDLYLRQSDGNWAVANVFYVLWKYQMRTMDKFLRVWFLGKDVSMKSVDLNLKFVK